MAAARRPHRRAEPAARSPSSMIRGSPRQLLKCMATPTAVLPSEHWVGHRGRHLPHSSACLHNRSASASRALPSLCGLNGHAKVDCGWTAADVGPCSQSRFQFAPRCDPDASRGLFGKQASADQGRSSSVAFFATIRPTKAMRSWFRLSAIQAWPWPWPACVRRANRSEVEAVIVASCTLLNQRRTNARR